MGGPCVNQLFYSLGFPGPPPIMKGIIGHLATLVFNSLHSGVSVHREVGQLTNTAFSKHRWNSSAPLLHSRLESTSAPQELQHFSTAAGTTEARAASVEAKYLMMAALSSFLSAVSRPTSENMHSPVQARVSFIWNRGQILLNDAKLKSEMVDKSPVY